jgi:DNA-directed RNA polymerase specialized sigma subunit
MATVNHASIGRQIENVKKLASDEDLVSQTLTVDQVRIFRPIFCFLNGKDRDILYLIFVSKKKQKEVQTILRRSQPSLCYDIKRIRRRLRFIFYLNSVFDIFIEFVRSKSHLFTPEEMDILTLMFYTSSFTQTAEILKVSQVRVRYSYDKCIRRMEEKEIWDAYEIFTVIRGNLNIVKRKYKNLGESMSEVFFPF